MNVLYRHTQTGVMMLAFIVPMIGLGVWLVYQSDAGGAAVIVGGVLLLLIFSTLTTTVTADRIGLAFGIGLVRRTIDLHQVADVAVVHNPWYYGWGIRYTPRGWLWNVSGRRGVELSYRNGRHFRIGSDEPDALAAAIQRALGQAR